VESSRDSVRTAWSISLAVYIAYGTIGTLVAVALTSLLCWYRCWCWVMQTLARLLLSRGERVCSDAYQLTGILISFPFYVRQICAQHVLGSVQDNRWCGLPFEDNHGRRPTETSQVAVVGYCWPG
jgi:hypothetical protein